MLIGILPSDARRSGQGKGKREFPLQLNIEFQGNSSGKQTKVIKRSHSLLPLTFPGSTNYRQSVNNRLPRSGTLSWPVALRDSWHGCLWISMIRIHIFIYTPPGAALPATTKKPLNHQATRTLNLTIKLHLTICEKQNLIASSHGVQLLLDPGFARQSQPPTKWTGSYSLREWVEESAKRVRQRPLNFIGCHLLLFPLQNINLMKQHRLCFCKPFHLHQPFSVTVVNRRHIQWVEFLITRLSD